MDDAAGATIEIRDVAVERNGRPVLADLRLVLRERRIGIIGANGSGKSTFARLLNGLVLPSSGSVSVDGFDTRTHGREVRRRVGFVFQNPDNQVVYPTVAEDLAFGLKALRLPADEKRGRVAAALRRYGLDGFENRLIHELSGGERQLVALAGVMIMHPSIVVLDEPTTLLDLRNKRRVLAAVEGSPEAVILVTHDLDLLAGFTRVLCFYGGRLVADGPPREVVGAYLRLIG